MEAFKFPLNLHCLGNKIIFTGDALFLHGYGEEIQGLFKDTEVLCQKILGPLWAHTKLVENTNAGASGTATNLFESLQKASSLQKAEQTDVMMT